ncbi:MAG: hypothetical protein AB8G18_18015 [Gammaproteobacteria bacterium]
MSDNKKISTLEADKERLLEALRELRKDGVTLIDDRVGRPAVVAAKPRAGVAETRQGGHTSADRHILDNIDRFLIEEPNNSNDPYNHKPLK